MTVPMRIDSFVIEVIHGMLPGGHSLDDYFEITLQDFDRWNAVENSVRKIFKIAKRNSYPIAMFAVYEIHSMQPDQTFAFARDWSETEIIGLTADEFLTNVRFIVENFR